MSIGRRGRILGMLLAMAMIITMVAACNQATPEQPPQASQPSQPAETGGEAATGTSGQDNVWEIAVVTKDATIPWFVRMETGVREFAANTGHNAYHVGPSASDATLQVAIIEDLIAQGVDAICVVPVDPATLEPVLRRAMDAGIVVVTHEASTQQNTMFNVEAFSNHDYGAYIMDNLAAAMDEWGKYVVMVGSLTEVSQNEWGDGAVARQLERFPNMELIIEDARVEILNDANVAYERAMELFLRHPDLRGIVGTSGHAVPAVARAIEELGLQGQVFTSGTGLPEQVAQFIRNGTVQSTVLWDPACAGYAMAVVAMYILDGVDITDGINLRRPGFENMRLVDGNQLHGSGWVTVTPENLEELLAAGL